MSLMASGFFASQGVYLQVSNPIKQGSGPVTKRNSAKWRKKPLDISDKMGGDLY